MAMLNGVLPAEMQMYYVDSATSQRNEIIMSNFRLGPAYSSFSHHRSWISPWIKSIINELDNTFHVLASQFSGHCDVISHRLCRHHQNVNRASGVISNRLWRQMSSFLSVFTDLLCRVRNKIMYVFSWRTVYVLTRMLFLMFISLVAVQKSGNKYRNNPFVNAY